MNFLFPGFLFALSAISVPVIIHLFNFRRYKTVYFSNVKFLKNIKQETKSKSQLKHLLVLIARILAIISLVFAFSQPYIPVSENPKPDAKEVIGIYIDNSYSMEAESKYGNLLEVGKNKVRNISYAYRPGTEFLFLTNDFESKHQHTVNRDQLLEFDTEVKPSPDVRKTSEILSRMKEFLRNEKTGNSGKYSVYIVSDFQKSTTDIDRLRNDSSYYTYLIPLATQQTNNLYIDSCWFETPGRKFNQTENLFIRVVNKSGESYQNIPVKLFINDSLKSLGSFNINPNISQNIKLSYNNTIKGIVSGRIEIADYPVTYDNTFYFSYYIADKIEVLAINEKNENKYLTALFNNDEYINLKNTGINNVNYSGFPQFDLIVLNGLIQLSSGLVQELVNYISNGGMVLFFPASGGDTASYNNFFSLLQTSTITGLRTEKITVDRVNYDAEIFRNVFTRTEDKVDLPLVDKHFIFTRYSRTNDESLLSAKGENILFQADYKKGRIYICAASLEEENSSFAKHAIFIPSVYNIALNSHISGDLYYIIGKDETIDISNFTVTDYNMLHISGLHSEFDFIPEHKADKGAVILFIHQVIRNSGNYIVKSDSRPVAGISFNYDRSESDLSYYDTGVLKEMIAKNNLRNISIIDAGDQLLTKVIQQAKQGRQLWKLFIILGLFFIGGEIALLRLWKK